MALTMMDLFQRQYFPIRNQNPSQSNNMDMGGGPNAPTAPNGYQPYSPGSYAGNNLPAPNYPGYIPTYNPGTQSLWSTLQDDEKGMDTSGLDAYKQEAMRTGPSKWANLAQGQQANLASNATSQAEAQSQSGRAQAETALGARGGLDSGARERLAMGGTRNLMDVSQGVNKDLATNSMQIGMNDEQNRMAELGALPGMQLNQFQTKANLDLNAKGADVQHDIQNTTNQNLFNMGLYHENMAAWGANRTAQATENSGTWLCTEADKREPLSLDDKKCLARLLKESMAIDKELVRFYVKRASALIPRMNAEGADWDENTRFVKRAIRTYKLRGAGAAYRLYRAHVVRLVERYWPECKNEPAYLRAKMQMKEFVAVKRAAS